MVNQMTLKTAKIRERADAVITFLSFNETSDGVGAREMYDCLSVADAPGWLGSYGYFRQLLTLMLNESLVRR